MRILNHLVLIGLTLFTTTVAVSARADEPAPLGPAESGGGTLGPDGAAAETPEPAAAPAAPGKRGRLADRQKLIDAAKASESRAVRDHLQAGIDKVGGEEYLVTKENKDWFNQLKMKLQAAKLTKKAVAADPSLAEPVATGGVDTEACPTCDKDRSKGDPLPVAQREPIERIRDVLPPPAPPAAAPPPPYVPAPAPSGPAFSNDLLLGGVFGLLAGVLLTGMLNKKQNQQRPFFPYRGMPMRAGGFPMGYRGGFGGRLGAPAFPGPASVGGGLGAPAVLPAIYSAPQYNIYGGTATGVNSVSMFGNTPLTTSPILGGALGSSGAPSVIRPY